MSLKAAPRSPRGGGGGTSSACGTSFWLPLSPPCFHLSYRLWACGAPSSLPNPLISWLPLFLPLSLTTLSDNILCCCPPLKSQYNPHSQFILSSLKSQGVKYKKHKFWVRTEVVLYSWCTPWWLCDEVIYSASPCFSFCHCVETIMILTELVHHLQYTHRVWDIVVAH